MSNRRGNALCGNCTFKLVIIAYRRAPWFRVVREPMLVGMRILARIHRVSIAKYEAKFPTGACYNCIRFYKLALRDESVAFRWLHGRVNPMFNYILGHIVTKEERKQAFQYGQAASAGTLNEKEIGEWMRGMKMGL